MAAASDGRVRPATARCGAERADDLEFDLDLAARSDAVDEPAAGPASRSPGYSRFRPRRASGRLPVEAARPHGAATSTSVADARPGRRVGPGSNASGVTTTGPRPSAKSRSFGPRRRTAAPVRESGEPSMRPSRPEHRRDSARARERERPAILDRSTGPETAAGFANSNDSLSSKTRIAGGRSTGASSRTPASGILGMLARRASAREERLQRLRGEMDDAVAVDASDPAALERVFERVEHAEPQASRLRVHHHVGDRGHRAAHALLDRARPAVRVRERPAPSSPSVRKTTMPSSVRTMRTSRAIAPVSSRTAASIAAVSISTASPAAVSRDRLEVRLHRTHLRRVAQDRRLDLLGDLVRGVERELAGKLQVQRHLGPPVDLEHREVVDLANVRDGERRRENALLKRSVRCLGSTWTTTSIPGKRVVQRGLDPVRGRVALADRRARGDADHDVGEVLASRSPQPQPPELDRRSRASRSRDARAASRPRASDP